MANRIVLKKSSVSAKVPLATDLEYGELALNYTDEKLYFKNASNVIKSLNVTQSTLTIGTGLSGTSYNGSSAVTIAINSTVATLTGTQTLTNKTLTSPRVGTGIFDSNGNKVLNIVPTASAVNELSISNAATGGSVLLSTAGTDTNINLLIQTKGTGAITIDTGTGAGQIDLKSGSSNVRVWDDDSSHYYQFVTGNRTANFNVNLPAGNVTLTAGTSVVTTRSISTTAPLAGGGNLSANRTLSLAAGYGDTQNPYASKTTKTFLAAPNAANGVPTFRTILASDIPTLNQNTTGSAATLTTARTLTVGNTGKTFNGSANVAWTLAEIGAYAATNPSGFTSNTGTVTSIGVTPGTGISVSGSPVTTSGNITVTNTAPNVTTNITTTHNASTVVVNSSDGTNGTINAATTTLAGVMTGADKTKLNGIAAGAQVNVATNLGITAGTTAGPIVTSSTGTNATLPTASATASGVVTTAAQTWAGVKTFNSTITGSISGNAATATNSTQLGGHVRNSDAATANTVAGRNGSGDIFARLIRQTFGNQTTISGGLVFRVNNSTDNFLRVCSDTQAIRTFLNVPTRTGGNASGTWGINITGNAATATTLQTTRAINGVNFNGSAAITVPGNFANRTTNESGHISFIGTTATGNRAQFTNTNIRVNPATATVTSETGAFAAPFLLNKASISTSYSIPSGYNAVAAGPVVIADGITVTIPTGSTWVIV